MDYQTLNRSKQQQVAELFSSVFTASEGEQEGALIGRLSAELASNIDNQDIVCLGAYEDGALLGCIIFTRLKFNLDIQVYMLAPVAVSTSFQGQGIGQALISYGLNELKKRAVEVVVTYGDPAFYSKVGFQALSEKVIQAPAKLSMPFGWLGLSLTGAPIPIISERPLCVEQFNNPAYW